MRLLAAMACLVVAIPALAQEPQERMEWLREHAVEVRSIDPDHEGFADLEPLKELIGDARVVQLGEQSHGDGAVFLAKCRLVEFLHKEMGFDVLVWESGVFDCRFADRKLRDPKEPIDTAWEGVFAIWGRSAQVQPVFAYVREAAATERPLEVAGYDCQVSSGKVDRWVEAVRAFVEPLGEEHPSRKVIEAIAKNAGAMQSSKEPKETIEGLLLGLENLAQLLDASKEALSAAHGEAEAVFMRRTVDDAIATTRMTLAFVQAGGAAGGAASVHLNSRDQRMGENLIWLANERYKGRKLIVWAATMHEVHDVQEIKPEARPEMYANAVTAGGVAKKALGDDLYTIGFEAHEGEAANCWAAEARTLPKSPKGSLGDLLAETGHEFCVVDFRSLPEVHWLRGPVTMRPLGYMPMKTRWARQMDAVFFIREMFRSTKEGRAPEGAVLTVKEE